MHTPPAVACDSPPSLPRLDMDTSCVDVDFWTSGVNTTDMGIEDVWPDDPAGQVRMTVESLRPPFTVEDVADRAEVTEKTARRELTRMEDDGWVERVARGEWRVVEDARGADGLFPLDED